jgi:thymidylate synthase (FAD)
MSNEKAGKKLKWKQFPVGTGGTICLVDWMGEDFSIVEAARVSYGEGTRHTSNDRQLIRYLMRHWHSTPFEMAELKFRVRVPMDTWRQWIRHRTASVNEYSTRYSVAIDEMAATLPGEWRLQAESNRQGSDGFFDVTDGGALLSSQEAAFHRQARALYEERLEMGVAREQARKDLPLSNYTEAYWKVNLHNLFHFLRLRMDAHAQQEIRDFAEIAGKEIIAKMFPHAWEAFVDYRLEAIQLSRLEIGVIQRMLIESRVSRTSTLMQNFKKCQDPSWKRLKKCRERDECIEKLEILGVLPNGSSES